MECPLFLNYVLVTIFLLYTHSNIAYSQDDPSVGYHTEERNALLALKTVFNDPFINGNWTHLQCYLNNTPMWYGIECSNGRVTGIVLENLGLTGKVNDNSLYNLTQLTLLSLKNNSVAGKVMDFSKNPKMTVVDLSGNVLSGRIDASLLGLKLLRSLRLENNLLTGPLIAFEQESLKHFNVSRNYLNGSIPNTSTLQSFTSDSYFGNLGLCGPPSDSHCTSGSDQALEPRKDSTDWTTFVKMFGVVDVVGLVIVIVLFITYFIKLRKLKKQTVDLELVEAKEESKKMESTTTTEGSKGKLVFVGEGGGFELDDLLKASAEELGKGSFGSCYKAKLKNQSPVVVKRLRDLKPLSGEEFMKQVNVIATQTHPNLLPLLACYYSKEEKLLVLKFAEKGSLYDRIHGKKGTIDRVPFKWRSRVRVARGVARAVEYLHSTTTSNSNIAPHGNLKPSNVLLDKNDVVLVSDYGLAALIAVPVAAQKLASHRSQEYQNSKKLSHKSDTWSYGTLLLELLTGRASPPPGAPATDLCSWVHRAVREEWTAEIFDFEIASSRNATDSMLTLLQVAMRCCDKNPDKRPHMAEVVREVESVRADGESEDEEEDLSNDRSVSADDHSSSNSASGGIVITSQ